MIPNDAFFDPNILPLTLFRLASNAPDVKHNGVMDEGPKDRNDIPNWALARRVVLGKDRAIGAMARSVCINTQWPQSRIKPNDDMCRACGVWTGNLRHRQFPDKTCVSNTLSMPANT